MVRPLPPGPESDPLALRDQVVLIVDDEEDVRESLRDVLEAYIEHVDVIAAGSGREALAVLAERPVDLIVSDYKMPGMNGLDFLAQARTLAPSVPRVIITAFPDMELAIRSINMAGIENFFTKPLDRELVIEVVRSHLFERRATELRGRAFARSLEVLRQRTDGR